MNQTNIIIVIVVFCIIIGFALSFQEKKKYNLEPKKIWTYWDNPNKIPKTVQMCISSWAKYNPSYEIILLTKKNFKGYVTIPDEIRNKIFYDFRLVGDRFETPSINQSCIEKKLQ